ncbi:type IV pilin-like G/H family protein [Oscillatoria acuminata]|uniref:Prepilin-type N-terminal cleavage/methylation domain-containing protein n=1 Tax=Oscillatoria acuminata PCC 6304 TaxID=56110 RepID=K9TBY2_9CYAN|nr:type IV pilin-like G/H family protein [Oscillatoria acuminata]AFY80050.1 prepilin-type N-terminal cleavage/methylation domain-containing protein [Oscillatoria acuminata PCC 6304]
MKTEFKAKFLQHINLKKREEGFTLIELLVVVIIIGILAAVALPSLLSQTNKAKQVEARNNVGAMNRAQQAVYLEQNDFATSMAQLGVGIPTATVNFKYSFNRASATNVGNIATARLVNLKPYSGLVWTEVINNQSTTQAILCEAKDPAIATDTAPAVNAGKTCGAMVTLGQ